MVLIAEVEELLDGVRKRSQAIPLDRSITIGRGLCDVVVGGSESGFTANQMRAISRVQATITIEQDGTPLLHDGAIEPSIVRSSNGIYVGSRKIDLTEPLVEGLEATLCLAYGAKVVLRVLRAVSPDSGGGQDTFTGPQLFEQFEAQLELQGAQIEELKAAIAQLQQRDATIEQQMNHLILQSQEQSKVDAVQFQQLSDVSQRLKKAIGGLLISVAVIAGLFLFSGELTQHEREEWRKLIANIVMAAVTAGLAGGGASLMKEEKKSLGVISPGLLQ